MISGHTLRDGLLALSLLPLLLVNGCVATSHPVPVSERSLQRAQPGGRAFEPDTRPDQYVVRKGDTLFSIALDYGLDYKELAAWNNISNPRNLTVGQPLRLRPPVGAVAAPLRSAPTVEGRPMGSGTGSSVQGTKSQPKAVKLPYSEQTAAQLQKPPVAEEKPAPDDENISWGWPAQGKLIATFDEAANAKGIDIVGKASQPVLASAAGVVLYSGSGIRGYGKLIVLRHNKTYSSVYAHNDAILVKEGQSVVKGQKIAEMGSSDSDKIELHFEIRRQGKPVDPAKLLPAP
ncbi:MAG TPA: peptidoglycan DD-metalloendopeptidase family protein [Burkholderiales bacterium]|nr:peptidoglycan DD-metalloendopeptidase family protein [Burkholderiales bacterium]